MKYDFDTILDRQGRDAIAVDAIGADGSHAIAVDRVGSETGEGVGVGGDSHIGPVGVVAGGIGDHPLGRADSVGPPESDAVGGAVIGLQIVDTRAVRHHTDIDIVNIDVVR